MQKIQTYITNNRRQVKGALYYKVQDTPDGRVLVAEHDGHLCWLGFDLDPQSLLNRFPAATLQERSENIDLGAAPLCLYGTEFQIKVWQRLLKIKAGTTLSYLDIARDIGHERAVRAVGSAVGANPVSVVVPCHRVLPRSGGVGHYLWGAEQKERLLKAEGAL